MQILGLGLDVVLAVLLVAGWFVVMRFVLPRFGVST
jgi:hypothetical protein